MSVEQQLSKIGSSEISIFHDPPPPIEQICVTVQKLSAAFPDMSAEFFDLLSEYIIKTGMTSRQLDYALTHVLTNFHYRKLTIADLLNVDLKCKTYSYAQMCEYVAKYQCTTDAFAPIWIGNVRKPRWVLREDKELYDLPERV